MISFEQINNQTPLLERQDLTVNTPRVVYGVDLGRDYTSVCLDDQAIGQAMLGFGFSADEVNNSSIYLANRPKAGNTEGRLADYDYGSADQSSISIYFDEISKQSRDSASFLKPIMAEMLGKYDAKPLHLSDERVWELRSKFLEQLFADKFVDVLKNALQIKQDQLATASEASGHWGLSGLATALKKLKFKYLSQWDSQKTVPSAGQAMRCKLSSDVIEAKFKIGTSDQAKDYRWLSRAAS